MIHPSMNQGDKLLLCYLCSSVQRTSSADFVAKKSDYEIIFLRLSACICSQYIFRQAAAINPPDCRFCTSWIWNYAFMFAMSIPV